MRFFSHFLKYFLLPLLLLMVGFSLYLMFHASVQVKGRLYVPGLQEAVTVTRDSYGVPTIEAKNEDDLFFAQGFVTAQDRLYQMVTYKYLFAGRMSEVVGEKAKVLDQYMRLMDFPSAAEESFQHLDARMQRVLQSYAKGVNAFLQQRQRPMLMMIAGMDISHWQPEDNLLIAKAIAWDMEKTWPSKLVGAHIAAKHGVGALGQYMPGLPKTPMSVSDAELQRQQLPFQAQSVNWPQEPAITEEVIQAFEPFRQLNHQIFKALHVDMRNSPGSNAWAVAPQKSHSGFAVMASDPHLAFHAPIIFHLVVLQAPGLSISGAAIPGSPGVAIGRNDHVAWGFTNGKVDQSSLWYTKELPKGHWRHETIQVKGEAPLTVDFYETQAGVVISDPQKPGMHALFEWQGRSRRDTTIQALFYLNLSRNVEDARAALAQFVTPTINAVVADSQGHILYQLAGAIQKRQYHFRVPIPLPKQLDENIAFDDLPRSLDPPDGFVFTSNNRLVSEHYPYNLYGEYDQRRVALLQQLLKAKPKMTLKDHIDIQHNERDNEWFLLRKVLMKPFNPEPWQQAWQILQAWDGISTMDAKGPTVFAYWLRSLTKAIYDPLRQELSPTKPVYDVAYVRSTLADEKACKRLGYASCAHLKQQAWHEAMLRLTHEHSSNTDYWRWGHVHLATFENSVANKVPLLREIYNRSLPQGGGRDSLKSMRWSGQRNFKSRIGASFRMVVDLATLDANVSIAMGESEDPLSPHYDNWLRSWGLAEYRSIGHQPRYVDDAVLTLMPER